MSVLIQLPEFAKDYVYRGALAHCAAVLMVSSLFDPWCGSLTLFNESYLIDRDPQRISDHGLAYLANDVRWITTHIASLENEHLNGVFTELDQVRLLST